MSAYGVIMPNTSDTLIKYNAVVTDIDESSPGVSIDATKISHKNGTIFQGGSVSTRDITITAYAVLNGLKKLSKFQQLINRMFLLTEPTSMGIVISDADLVKYENPGESNGDMAFLADGYMAAVTNALNREKPAYYYDVVSGGTPVEYELVGSFNGKIIMKITISLTTATTPFKWKPFSTSVSSSGSFDTGYPGDFKCSIFDLPFLISISGATKLSDSSGGSWTYKGRSAGTFVISGMTTTCGGKDVTKDCIYNGYFGVTKTMATNGSGTFAVSNGYALYA